MSTHENYIGCFLKHVEEGAKLFHAAGDSKESAEGKAALGICALAAELAEKAAEVRTLTDIFAALDAKGQGAVLQIMELTPGTCL